MILEKIELTNFRNYSSLTLLLNSKLNFFVGKNGMGKTNILEAIYFLAITKSQRNNIEKKLIKEGSKKAKVKGIVKTEKHLSTSLEVDLTEVNKIVKIDNHEIRKLSDYISSLNVILFSPESIELIKGSPIVRRKFLNIEIAQINRKYLKILSIYNNLLKNRNEYLKKINESKMVDEVYFDIITNKLIENAIYIYQNRKEFIDKINEEIGKIYLELANSDSLRIKYLTNISDYSSESISSYLLNKYKSSFKSEVEQGKTLYGPHRDDFLFVLNDKDVRSYGSQGQQRLALLSLKLSEINIFKEATKTNPIVLLDDIFSELDNIKKKNILDYIAKDIQVIITTTMINKRNLHNANIYHITNGNITKIEEVK